MSGDRRSVFSFLVMALTLATHVQAQSSATTGLREDAPTELVGRWILIATIRNGEDVTQAGVTQADLGWHGLIGDRHSTVTIEEKAR